MSKKVVFEGQTYGVYNLDEHYRFSLETDLEIKQGTYMIYPMSFVFEVDKSIVSSMDIEDIEVYVSGFDGDDLTSGELLIDILYKDNEIANLKLWTTILRYENFDIEGFNIINKNEKCTIQLFTKFSCEIFNYADFLESNETDLSTYIDKVFYEGLFIDGDEYDDDDDYF